MPPVQPRRSVSRGPRLTAEARRALILECAAREFAERGYEGARTRQIAKACGGSEAILYRHFESKEALFRAALEHALASHDAETFLGELDPELPAMEVFRTIAEKILSIGLEDRVVHRLLLAASLAGPEETRSAYVAWRLPFVNHLQRVVQRGIDEGTMRRVDPLLSARAFVGLVTDCVMSCELWTDPGEGRMSPTTLIENNVPIFVLGLLKDTTSPS